MPIKPPTEADEAKSLVRWASFAQPGRILVHIPNEGRRSARTGAHLKAQGMIPGFPDFLFLVPSGRFHGLAIELKRRKGGKVSEEQIELIRKLEKAGYAATVAHGWEEAARAIESYMKNGVPAPCSETTTPITPHVPLAD